MFNKEQYARENWISVDHEGIPWDDRKVLVNTADGMDIASYDEVTDEWVMSDGRRLESQFTADGVDHWRLLPLEPQ